MTVLMIAEHDNQSLKQATYHAMSAAAALSQDITLLIVGYQCGAVVEEAKTLLGITQVLVADAAVYVHPLAENMAPLMAEVGANYDYILATASTFSKNILPRIAALLDTAMISDVIKIMSPDTFERPIYAGNALATVQSHDKIKVLTVRSTAFPVAKKVLNATVEVEKVSQTIVNDLSTYVGQELTVSSRPELTSARIVVSGGRGLKSAENFKLLEKLADQLGAAIGASRAAVDAGYAPNDYQVGQTGKVVAPDLYIAVGISGAIQHMAGMKESKVIVAINSDPDAPIFQIADYGLVGDLFTLLPELQAALEK